MVLGLLGVHGPSTPYDLKALISLSVGNFWSFPHSQVYAEAARLAQAGLADEERETEGRRRRSYTITPAGLAALRSWLETPSDGDAEIRDLGLLKLFFGSMTTPEVVSAHAREVAERHRSQLAAYDELADSIEEDATSFEQATLEFGRRWERMVSDFWTEIADNPPR